LIATLSLVAVAILPACNPDAPPSSLFNAGGYHVRGEKVYYLHSFPGDAFEIEGVDPATFLAFDQTYARDKSTVYVDGHALPGADAATFELLDRPTFARDAHHVYQRDRPLSDDPAHFELLDGNLSKGSSAVYWSDGEVLSDDPEHFAIISNADHYLFTKDTGTVHVNGKPIHGADPATFRVLEGPYASDNARVYWMGKPIDGAYPASFRVLNADFECSADARRAYYRNSVVAGADPSLFPPNRAVTRCDETSMSFAD
jgi:hypothetical protein